MAGFGDTNDTTNTTKAENATVGHGEAQALTKEVGGSKSSWKRRARSGQALKIETARLDKKGNGKMVVKMEKEVLNYKRRRRGPKAPMGVYPAHKMKERTRWKTKMVGDVQIRCTRKRTSRVQVRGRIHRELYS